MKNSLLFLLILAASCATVNQTEGDFINLSEEENTSFGDFEFAEEELTSESLKAYEQVALDKFSEFIEQIKIAINDEYEDDFKRVAEESVSKSLLDFSQYPSSPIDKKPYMETGQFLASLMNKGLDKKVLYKVAMTKDFEPLQEDAYIGRIEFHFNDALEPESIDVYLLKVVKEFGTDQHTIWEIRFGYF